MEIREDVIANFVQVVHPLSGDKFRIHKDDLTKVGSKEKIAVFTQPTRYLPPDKNYPKGKYLAKVRFFLGEFLEQVKE